MDASPVGTRGGTGGLLASVPAQCTHSQRWVQIVPVASSGGNTCLVDVELAEPRGQKRFKMEHREDLQCTYYDEPSPVG